MDIAPDRRLAHGRAAWALGQVALIAFCIVVYFGVRGLTEGSPHTAVDHAHDLVDLERALGIDVEAQVQEPFIRWPWLGTLANWVYIWGHWPVIVTTMVWLLWKHRPVFERLRDAMLISGLAGMFIFALYPVAPPRLAGLGLVDTVSETSHAYRVLQPPAFVNQYAAMPSLHVGWNLLVGMALLAATSSVLLRVLGWLMPLLMALAVVATANHYVLDVVAGVTLVLLAHLAALALERRRGSWAGAPSAQPQAPPR